MIFSNILTESWYKDKQIRPRDEAERVILTATQLLKNEIRNYDHKTDVYPSIDEDLAASKKNVPPLLGVFINALIKSPLKQMSISEAVFSAARARTITPLQLGLAVTADNEFASKKLNMLLNKLGFAASYDEVSFHFYF